MRRWTSESRRGHTLSEVMMAGSLLLTMLGLVTAPIVLTTRSMQSGQAKIDSQHQVREPIDRLYTELRNGFNLEFGAADNSGNNSVTFYDSRDKQHFQINYTLDTTTNKIMRTVSQWSSGTSYSTLYGGASAVASGVTLLSFQPYYQPEENATGPWAAYTLPVPDSTVTSNLPPHMKRSVPVNTLVLVRVVSAATTDSPPIDLSTSFYTRN